MASSSLTVYVNGEELRKYGGVRREVKMLKSRYENMSYGDFIVFDPRVSREDFDTLELVIKLNKS